MAEGEVSRISKCLNGSGLRKNEMMLARCPNREIRRSASKMISPSEPKIHVDQLDLRPVYISLTEPAH